MNEQESIELYLEFRVHLDANNMTANMYFFQLKIISVNFNGCIIH